MQLRDHPVLNLLRRLRGWTRGDARLMVEARQDGQHYFRVFEARGETAQAREAAIAEALAADGAHCVEIAQESAACVPMPPDCRAVALSDRIYFGEMSAASDAATAPRVRPR